MKTDDYEFYKDSFNILDNDYALWMKEKTNTSDVSHLKAFTSEDCFQLFFFPC